MAPLTKTAANGAAAAAAANGDVNHEPINVIIPIGGIGSRFAKEGYRYPKPLINIVGRPMLLWLIDNLSLKPGDTLWMAINEEVDDEFRIGQLVSKTFSKIDFRLLRLRHQTKGASETGGTKKQDGERTADAFPPLQLFIVTQSMTKKHLERKTVSLDCDTIYWADVLQDIRNMPKGHGGCFYFPDVGDKPIFSYIKTEPTKDGLERIVDIQEKKAISNKANTGAYVFPSAAQLKSWAAENLDMKRPDGSEVGEYYTSQMIALMIQNGVPYLGMPVSTKDFSVVGTPEQLKDLLKLLKTDTSNLPIKLKKRRFCFDLDMTLVGVPAVAGDYSTCPPIEKNIRLVQQLYNAGHYIIIQTARRMRTHHGNLGSVLADVGPVTFAQLAKYEIPYHDIHFGKPYADVYVDDLAVNANLDTMREIGWLLDEHDPAALIGQDAGTAEDAKKAGMIAARDFNTIQIIGDKVIKSSKSENILGELFFYSHMPAEIAHIFPTVYNVDYIPDTTTYNITMENRRGLTFSHLLVGRSITKGRLISLLKALHSVHTTASTDKATLNIPSALEKKFEEHSLARANNRVNIYANYGSKLRSRYYQHQDNLQEHFFTFLEETYSVRLHRKTLFRITASLFFSLIPLHRPELGAVFLRMCKETLDKASNINYGPGTRSTAGVTLSRRASSNFGAEEKAREMPIVSGKGENLSIPNVVVTAK
ncbi:protein phosphatase 2A a subunit [Colletotrichum tofieldiae]|nr:protein phosphatase 2A a subunit [Colletotrichum tofieldiae]GKT79485.1 protein phosphatase 2A a subunit [Colletotrichum tofieldiae]